MVCTETWLNSNSPNEAYNIPGFSCFRKDRPSNVRGGGVAIWVNGRSFCGEELSLGVFERVDVCFVRLTNANLLVCGVYLPPGLQSDLVKNFKESFESVLDGYLISFPHDRVIIAGDFNKYDMSFFELHFSLKNIVTGATRLNACLDHIYVDRELLLCYDKDLVEIGPPIGNSDHKSVFVPCGKVKRLHTMRQHHVYDFRESHVVAFEKRFLGCELEKFYAEGDIDVKCSMFYEFMHTALEEIPTRVVSLSDLDVPWMTPFLKYLIDRRWDAYRSRNWACYTSLKEKVKRAVAVAKSAFANRKSGSVREMWSFVNFVRGSSGSDIFRCLDEYSSKEELLNACNDHFCSVMNPQSGSMVISDLTDDEWLPHVGVTDVWRELSHLPIKATGSDGIPCMLYRRAATVLAEPIHHLIVECFRLRKFPSLWKIADVVPVPKPGKVSVENSRPISLLPIPAKLAEKFVLADMKRALTKLLGDRQFGIRKHSSTTHAIITVHDMLTRHADDPTKGASVLVCFDFSKAFDKVDHRTIVNLLRIFNLPHGFCILMENYLDNRCQRVRVGGSISKMNHVTSGVPQGSLLGPFLFGLLVSTLEPIDPNFTCMVKYVDDICMVFSIRKDVALCLEDIDKVRMELEGLSRWANCNGLSLNTEKTIGLIRYRGDFKSICDIATLLPAVKFRDCVRLLGVMFDADLGWKSHVKFVEKKCSQRFYILRRIRRFVSMSDFVMIYCGIIRSLLEYAGAAFVGINARESGRLQRIENRCLRMLGSRPTDFEDLTTRRRRMASQLLASVPFLETVIKDLLPPLLPSGRLALPFSRTSLRRNAFFPRACIIVSSIHCD